MAKNINRKPYPEESLTKLEIFEKYATEWLPVFYRNEKVMICDFFSGSGQDSVGIPGSPLRILNVIKKYRDHIYQNNTDINILFNDKSPEKIKALKLLVSKINTEKSVNIKYESKDFKEVFLENYNCLKSQPNLIFIDQYGIKQVTDEVFSKLISLEKTDFLFFISSSTIKRFAETDEFRTYLPGLDINKIKKTKHHNIHRAILEYYKSKIPSENKTKLYPFTIKNGANIYGLVFGSKHPLGVQKFLDLAWKENILNGEANFDIDDDYHKSLPRLFPALKKPTKIELFENKLKDYIKQRDVISNKDIYDFTLLEGHPKKHAGNFIRKLKKKGIVEYSGTIGYSYDSCYNKDLKFIRVKNNG